MPDNFSKSAARPKALAKANPEGVTDVRTATVEPTGPDKLRVVFRLSALGDVALLTGLLEYWQRLHGWRFVVLTKSQYSCLFLHHPAVQEVVGLGTEELSRARVCFKKLASRFAGLTLLDLHASLRSRLLGLVWKGPVRRYPKYSMRRRLFLRFKSQRGAELLRRANVPQRYALAVESAAPPEHELAPKIYLSAEEREAAARRLGEIFPAAAVRPVILHPYATHARKEWPLEHWRALTALLERQGLDFLVVGQCGPADDLAGSPIWPDKRNLTNATNLRELCAILERGSLLLTGDSGPMHLGVGVGVPVLALFGPTTREWGFFPPAGKNRVLELPLSCRPCSLHGGSKCPGQGECMSGLGPEPVFKNILEMLGTPGV